MRRLIRQDFDRAFEEVDLIVGPVTPTPAFKIGERIDDPLAMYSVRPLHGEHEPGGHRRHVDPLRLQFRPACRSACTCKPRRLPKSVCSAAPRMFQQATDWHTKQPPLEGLTGYR